MHDVQNRGIAIAVAKQAFINAYGSGPAPSGSPLSLDQIAALSSTEVANLDPAVITQFTGQQLQALPHFEALNAQQSAAIGWANGSYLLASQLQSLSASAVSGLTPNLISNLSGEQVGAISNVQGLTSIQASALTGTNSAGLLGAQIQALQIPAILSLTEGAVHGLTAAAVSAFSAAQAESLTRSQVSALQSPFSKDTAQQAAVDDVDSRIFLTAADGSVINSSTVQKFVCP